VIWNVIRATISAGLAVADAVVNTSSRLRRIGRALLPRRREDAYPLTYRDVEHQREQMRSATSYRVEPVPPTQRSRTDKPR
jgi:hypothetical protein